MLNGKRITYAYMADEQKNTLERRIRRGDSINSIYAEGVFNRDALNYLVSIRGIPYDMGNRQARRKKPKKPTPVRVEDIPRLCLNEMSDRIKNLNTLWRPTKNIGEQL